MNQSYQDILDSVKTNNLEFTESLVEYAKHRSELKLTFQFNLMDLIEKKTKDPFLKMFSWDNGQWIFSITVIFEKTGFMRTNQNYYYSKSESENYVIVSGQHIYLLYSPFIQVIDMLF